MEDQIPSDTGHNPTVVSKPQSHAITLPALPALPRLRLRRIFTLGRLIRTSRSVRESIAVPDVEPVRPAVLAIVRREAGRPRLIVHSAVLAHRFGTIVKHIRVKELARLRVSINRYGAVIVGRSGTSSRAERGGERAGCEDLHAHVGIRAGAVEGGVDGEVSERGHDAIAGGDGDGGRDVAVGAGYHDVEVVLVLAGVCGRGGGHGAAVVDAFDYGCGGRVCAAGFWGGGTVALVIWRIIRVVGFGDGDGLAYRC